MENDERLRQLNALKLADFGWVKNAEDVWTPSEHDVPALHREAEIDFSLELVRLIKNGDNDFSPPGLVVSGPGGSGKTHLLSRFARIAIQNGAFFLMADLSGVGDLMETVLEGAVRSLPIPLPALGGKTQTNVLVENILKTVNFKTPGDLGARHARSDARKLNGDLEKVLDRLGRTFPRESADHAEVLRAVFLLNSEDPLLKRAALNWLRRRPPSIRERERAGFATERPGARETFAGLSFFLSLNGGMTVLAMDRIDHLASLFDPASPDSPGSPGDSGGNPGAEARKLVRDVSDGIGRIPELAKRTLAVVSCLPATWELLSRLSRDASLDRYRRPPIRLAPMTDPAIPAKMVAGRMKTASRKAGLVLPHPTWPFAPGAFENVPGLRPRVLLERCHELVRDMLLEGEIREIDSIFGEGPPERPAGAPRDPARPPATPPGDSADAEEARNAPGGAPDRVPDDIPDDAGDAPPGENDPPLFSEGVFVWGAGENDFDPESTQSLLSGLNIDFGEDAGLSVKEEIMTGRAPDPAGPLFARRDELLLEETRDLFKDPETEDVVWPEAFRALLEPMVEILRLPPSKTLSLELGTGENPPVFHATLSFRDANDKKASRKLFLRAANGNDGESLGEALENALERSGINPANPDRRLVLLRFSPKPQGRESERAFGEFESRGGLRSKPSDGDLALLNAVMTLKREFRANEFLAFMEKARPWEKVLFLEESVSWVAGIPSRDFV
ncbi:MAG: ATP-binding protein [Deltaproteobacteria bacterium]|jgi:hypothetical protein|nr:ATP-binding protein [Deltaproteobacteria bacterium]